MYPALDTTPSLNPCDEGTGKQPPKHFKTMKRILLGVILMIITQISYSQQENQWTPFSNHNGWIFLYQVSECEEGNFVLLNIMNSSGMDPVNSGIEIVITENGDDQVYPIDLTELEGSGPWTGICSEYDRNLRFPVVDGTNISLRLKQPSED
jgi:hypothetical protein